MTLTKTPISRYIKAHGLWFHYLEWENRGPLAVLAHAAGFCAWVWAPLARSLSAKGYRVLSIDIRGHGDTERALDGDYSWRPVGRDMAELLEKLNIRDALAIGHSFGAGALMLGEALSSGHIRCAFHMEPPFIFRPRDSGELEGNLDPLSRQSMRRRNVWGSRQELFESYQSKPLFQKWHPDYLWAYVEGCTRLRKDGEVELKCAPEVEARTYMNASHTYPELWDLLRNYKPPTTVLVGSLNGRVPSDSKEVQRLREMAPNTQVVTVEGVGHFFPMEEPEKFEEMLWQFVAEVEAQDVALPTSPELGLEAPPIHEEPLL